MNVALSAVIIFILLAPPVIFYFSYLYGEGTKPPPKFSLPEALAISAIFSLFVHSLSIALIGKIIRFDILIKLLGGELKDLEHKTSNEVYKRTLYQFAVYNLVILSIAVSAGRFYRYLIKRFNLHKTSGFHQLHNPWVYFFNGYYIGEELKSKEIDLVMVDAVVDTADGSMIYSGYLIDFITHGNELERIYLIHVARREFKKTIRWDDKSVTINEPGEPFFIPGDLFSLLYSDIKQLNLRFLSFEPALDEIDNLMDKEPV